MVAVAVAVAVAADDSHYTLIGHGNYCSSDSDIDDSWPGSDCADGDATDEDYCRMYSMGSFAFVSPSFF